MRNSERGSVVAETALVLPTLLLITTLLISGLAAVDSKVKCTQLAASIARAIERDERDWRLMAEAAMPDAKVEISTSSQWVKVIVSKKVVRSIEVEGSAVALQRI